MMIRMMVVIKFMMIMMIGSCWCCCFFFFCWLTDSNCGPFSKEFGLLQRDLPFSLWMSVCLAAQPDRFASKFAIAAILTNDGPLLHFASEFPANNNKKRLCLAGNSRQAFVCIKTNCKILCVCVLQNNQSSYPTVVFVSASKLNSLDSCRL